MHRRPRNHLDYNRVPCFFPGDNYLRCAVERQNRFDYFG